MTPVRSPRYLAHVREQPCCCASFARARCSGEVVAHHHGRRGGGGTSIKTSDLHTVPLCDHHHNAEFHKTGSVEPFGRMDTELLFARAMVDCLTLALQSGLKL